MIEISLYHKAFLSGLKNKTPNGMFVMPVCYPLLCGHSDQESFDPNEEEMTRRR